MTRRGRLTLVSVMLAAALAAATSALYLKKQIEKHFQFGLQRSETFNALAADEVARSLEKHPDLTVPEALAKDEELPDRLLKLMSVSSSLLEIAVCDPNQVLLLSTDSSRRVGELFPGGYADFRHLVGSASLLDKIDTLRIEGQPKYYQLSEALESEGEGAVVFVRVVVYPALLRNEVIDDARNAAAGSLVAILVAMIVALVFSAYAFKPLGRVTEMLDHMTKGEYEPGPGLLQNAADEFGPVFSKVSLLGQQLGNFERLLDQLEEAVLVFGRDRSLVVASGALDKFLGRRRSELMGLPIDKIFPPDAPVGLFLDEVGRSGKPVRQCPVQLHNGAAKPGRLSCALLSVEILETTSSGTKRNAGMLIRLRDPEARRQIEGQLQTADRLSAISRITSGVAHEVKNPLNAIRMHVELLRMKIAKGTGEDMSPQLEIITNEILRLDRVVKTFLDFSRPTELKMNQVRLDGLIGDLVDLARPQASGAGVAVATELSANGALIQADADMLRQALLNIVVNGIEAMPDGGELRLVSGVAEEEAEIRIIDTGCGIRPEMREKIFQLYYTTKEKGSGIGLAITFRMVQLHGGRIDFSSEPGKGTTFVLRFPLAGTA